ncbi:hypothetical protein O181_042201 [Austropuccinia psidii MF-1]|uniref:Integrase catalytic domain-containing protein n=1 Tax=Austropuccinia psidii MF-1 TaxID=1389203 RepID=A0A9Q3DEF1_9BASI|nr:hypothetical protein [Austropuccinia psidii MF-1]
MYHLADSLAMSKEATENPPNALNRLQNYAGHLKSKQKVHKEEQLSTELVSSSSNYPSRLVYYCAIEKKEKDEKSNPSPSTHLSTAYALMTCSSESSCEIVIDSAATHHMFNDKSLFTNLKQCTPFVISTGDPASNLCAEGRGPIDLQIRGKLLRLDNFCLYVPRISHNLISMIQLLEDSITIEKLSRGRFKAVINHDTAITGQFINGLISVTHAEPKALISIGDVWNPSNQAVKTLGLPPFSSTCEICMLVDTFTSLKFVRFLKPKSEAFKEFVEWKVYAENFHSLKIKKLISNRGGDFENKNFAILAASCGFVHLFAPTSTPEHNGFAECANRTILDKARCLLLTSNLTRLYWAEAMNTG